VLLGVSIDFFVLSFLKKAFIQSRTLNEKERMKKEDEKARTESFIFPSTQKEREKQRVYSYKREYILQLVLSQTRSFEEEERGQREASSFS
jgi:hypothetical protein